MVTRLGRDLNFRGFRDEEPRLVHKERMAAALKLARERCPLPVVEEDVADERLREPALRRSTFALHHLPYLMVADADRWLIVFARGRSTSSDRGG
jgi:hypothetical protein